MKKKSYLPYLLSVILLTACSSNGSFLSNGEINELLTAVDSLHHNGDNYHIIRHPDFDSDSFYLSIWANNMGEDKIFTNSGINLTGTHRWGKSQVFVYEDRMGERADKGEDWTCTHGVGHSISESPFYAGGREFGMLTVYRDRGRIAYEKMEFDEDTNVDLDSLFPNLFEQGFLHQTPRSPKTKSPN